MDVNQIIQLEKKYQEILWQIFDTTEVQNTMFELEKSMRSDFEIASKYIKSNISDILFERLCRYYIYRSDLLDIISPFHSPISSDIAFETNDAVIFLDQKTIDMKGNRGDKPYIFFNINQITFENINVYRGSAKFKNNEPFDDFEGVYFHNNLTLNTNQGMFKNKPILTFIIGLHIYPGTQDSTDYKIIDESFKDREMFLSCLPNYKVAKTYFNNQIITKFKTYEWVDTKNEYAKFPDHMPLSEPKENFKEFQFVINNGPNMKETTGNFVYYDDSLNSPLDPTSKTVWGKAKAKSDTLYALMNGKTPRIRKTFFSENKNEMWRLKTSYFD